MSRLRRECIALALALGLEVEYGRRHLKVKKNGQLVTVIPWSPREHGRNMSNYRAALMRAAREEE